jgi:hypothetical protein
VVYAIGGRDLSVEDGKAIFNLAKSGASLESGVVMYGVKG